MKCQNKTCTFETDDANELHPVYGLCSHCLIVLRYEQRYTKPKFEEIPDNGTKI